LELGLAINITKNASSINNRYFNYSHSLNAVVNSQYVADIAGVRECNLSDSYLLKITRTHQEMR